MEVVQVLNNGFPVVLAHILLFPARNLVNLHTSLVWVISKSMGVYSVIILLHRSLVLRLYIVHVVTDGR